MTTQPELLAPAGSPEALDAAAGAGADAVYLGLKNFNARIRSANFTYAQFEHALRAMHRLGKKIYVTVNTVFEQRESDRMYQLLKYLADAGPDALIVQDFGVVSMVRSCFPSLKMHASTQMNIASARGVNALSRHGLSRVVLARELSIDELRAVRAETNMELEVFVHGSLCVSASGICLFSGYLGGKSANRGMCTQACRRLYRRNTGGIGALESGYYFSPGDLQLLPRIPELSAAGINAFKIEGRMKSAEYVGAVVSAYRMVIDSLESGEAELCKTIARAQDILRTDFARAKTEFYFDRQSADEFAAGIDWINPAQDGGTGISLGGILAMKDSGDTRRALIQSPDAVSLRPGDTVRLHRSDDTGRSSHKLTAAEPAAGYPSGSGALWISVPEGFKTGDRVYLIQIKSMTRRYPPVFSHNAAGGRSPGREKAPRPSLPVQDRPKDTSAKRNGAADSGFPEGIYVAVSRIDDLYIVQSSRPARVMLHLNRKTAAYLRADNKPPLPFKPADIILVLDPYFPQEAAEKLSDNIRQFADRGYRQFVLNNPGHFSLFRGITGCKLIAGPWLYMFNRWAFSFVASWGVDGYVSPLENNRQNLERTLSADSTELRDEKGKRSGGKQSANLRALFFVPVFAWPALFHIRADMGQKYDFGSFFDNRDEQFFLVSDRDGSLVFPETPFSIIDKIPFLKEAGFKRFIIDLSGKSLKKSDYRDLMRAVADGTPLPRVSRFNWKDGFFQNSE